ncbi:Crp/Fnr family transcriptional regulator [Intestinibacter bartlettii]
MIGELTLNDIKSINVFTNIKKDTIEKLLKTGCILKLNKKQVLFYERDILENVYFLLSGKASIYKMNEFGERKVIFILNEGEIINEVFLSDVTSTVTCEAFEKSTIIKFNKKDFIDIMENDFNLVKNIIKVLEHRDRRLCRQLKNSTYIKIEKKLAAKLYRLNREFGVKKGQWYFLDVPGVTVTYLADMLGCKRETLSRAMKILQNDNLVKIEGKKIYIKPDELSLFFKN